MSNNGGDRSLPAITDRIRDLEAALDAASREVTALRTSKSWRITAPLRKAYDVWLRGRRPV
jgi:hypothetical protein